MIIFSLFILLSGFVVGLGAVTVIDMLGFLGRKSEYWTETTIRAHKVTKPLIWVGIFLVIIGSSIFFKKVDFGWVETYNIASIIILILNGCFLSFILSPKLLEREKQGKASELLPPSWQKKITVSLIISDIFWWSSLFCLAYALVKMGV